MNVITKEDPHLIIDHHKIEREKARVMDELRNDAMEQLRNSKLECFFFDGKKDKSKVKLEAEGSDKVFMGMQREEHVSMCKEPGGEYIHIFTPGDATKVMPTAEVNAQEILKFIEYSKQLANVLAVVVTVQWSIQVTKEVLFTLSKNAWEERLCG